MAATYEERELRRLFLMTEDDHLPDTFLISEEDRIVALTPAASASLLRGSPESDNILPYEIMTPFERARALHLYETEIEWFHWQYLLEPRKCTDTWRGVNAIHQIAGEIRLLGLSVYFLRKDFAAFRLLYELVQCETQIIGLDVLGNASGWRREFSQETRELAMMAWNSVRRPDCTYRCSLSDLVLRECHDLFTSIYEE